MAKRTSLGGGNYGNGRPFSMGNPYTSHPGDTNGRYQHGGYVGGRPTPELHAYLNARQRCTNPNNDRYADWGGRGIEFRFTSFNQFLSELGLRPSGYVLDRKDNDGHYEPGNVRWVSKEDSAKNKRRYGGAKHRNAITGRYVPDKESQLWV